MLIRITNTPRPYAWGSTTAISDLLGSEATGDPQAELWFGSHPGSPARIVQGAVEKDLHEWAATHSRRGRLPFLLKVLAAAGPLSLQVHPTASQAQAGFDRENALGIPVDDGRRNYKDPWPKPELIVALSGPFRALCGFRAVGESRADLLSLDEVRLDPLIERLADDQGLTEVVSWLLGGGETVDGVVRALGEHAAGATSENGEEAGSWLATIQLLADAYPGDPGIAISALMHTVLLQPGEALYLPAGNIHAYLEGLGMELMIASDNVLRGGLTTKHVDVPELLSVLDARPLPVPRLKPGRPISGVAVYAPVDVELALAIVDDSAVTTGVEIETDDEAIILILDGCVELTEIAGAGASSFGRGDAALLVGGRCALRGSGRVVVASTKFAVTSDAGS